jgi:hypothetical protein
MTKEQAEALEPGDSIWKFYPCEGGSFTQRIVTRSTAKTIFSKCPTNRAGLHEWRHREDDLPEWHLSPEEAVEAARIPRVRKMEEYRAQIAECDSAFAKLAEARRLVALEGKP